MVGEALTPRHTVLFVLPALLLVALAGYLLPSRIRPLASLPFFFLVGLLHTQSALHSSTDPSLLPYYITTKTRATVVGTILTMPEFNGSTSRLILECESLLIADQKHPSSFQPVRGKLLLTVGDRLPPTFHAGSKVMAIASIDRIHRYQTPGAFNYPLQMATKDIACSGWIQSVGAAEIVTDLTDTPPFISFLQRLRFAPEQMRQHMAQFLEKHLEPETAALYKALLIGSLVNIPPETLEAFKVSGCFHLLAISGLHFSLLGLFALAMFTFLLKRSHWLLLHTHVPTVGLLLTAPLLLLYAFVAGMNLPALRALITALLVLVAVLLRRQRSFLPLIAAAALIIMAINPLALFTASFQLSFAAVLAINLISPRLACFRTAAGDQPPWHQLLGRGWRLGQSMFFVSLAATAGTLPILLFHFNRVSLVGPVMNLVIEPLLCLWSLPWGLAAFLLLWGAPDLAALCLQCGSLGIEAAVQLIQALQSIPHLSLWTITPSPPEILLYICILWLLIRRPPLPYRLSLATVLTLLLAGSFTSPLWLGRYRQEAEIHFLDIGQGTSTLVQLPQGKTVLIDGGGYESDRFDTGQNLIAPYLWRSRLWRLDEIIITHPHSDHYNGLPFVIEHFHPQKLIVNGDEGKERAYRQLLARERQAEVTIEPVNAGTTLHRSSRSQIQCLGMPGLPGVLEGTTNDRSLVIFIQNGEYGFLFPGDIGARSEQILVDSGQDLRATVLLAPHHGSRGSATAAFIAAVDPAAIVVSSGRQRQGILPAPEHLLNWAEQKILALLTSEHGTITCTSDGNGLRIKSFSGKCFVWNNEDRRFEEEKSGLKGKRNRGMLSN
jgi:competence protein ComEC